VLVSADTLVKRLGASQTTVVNGQRYMVTWKMLGVVIKAAGMPVRLVQLNSGTYAYTLVS
jgi:hypothetical protein